MRSQTARFQVQHSSSHQLPWTRLLRSWGTSTRKPALASSKPQFALTLAYGLVFSFSHWPSSLPDTMVPHDLSQLPSGSAGREKQTGTTLIITGHLSQTQLHSWKRTGMYTPTRKDKLLKDCRTHSLLWWQSTVELHPASYLQSNATKPSASKLPLTIILK